jgi:hypothetical protein
MVEIEYNLMLVDKAGRKTQEIELPAALPLPEFLLKLGLGEEDVGMLLINRVWAPLDCVIRDGDFVQLYPNLEGG